ncbi:MAG TPA: hypothetical protein VFV83_10960 [Chthoniobacteraceae bacterium]|nr:hypothetical protein [Chthoniobacteraceae bacterium]
MKPTPAKIIQHSQGLGVPSMETVRKRAAELARIDGRTEYNENDWRDAKRELHGGHDVLNHDGTAEMAAMVSERDFLISDIGHRVDTSSSDAPENPGEELVAEGMDEAVHDQMLAAASDLEREDEE